MPYKFIWIFFLLILPVLTVLSQTASPAKASSVHSRPYQPDYAIDGNKKTRWASRTFRKKPEWLQVDFGKPIHLRTLTIYWEYAYAKEYDLEISNDGKTWQTMITKKDGRGGRETFKLDAEGRYFRMLAKKHGPHALFSIWELEFRDNKGQDPLAKLREALALKRKQKAVAKAAVLKNAFSKFGVKQIVFVERNTGGDGHWYANFGYYAPNTGRRAFRGPSRLCVLDVATGKVDAILEDREGTMRDPVVHYDAKKILFSYRNGKSAVCHLYEINIDGTGLKPLTDGRFDDLEPTYLPDGGIMFVSGRSKRWVNCWLTQVATLHRCDANGKNIRQISANIEQDNTPWVLPDGRVIYQRWEYVDRSQVHYHHLWATNPDGTGQMIYYGNQRPGGVFIDAKPIPGTDRVIMINSPAHGRREHEGAVAIVTDQQGPDYPGSLRNITRGGYRDPWAFSEDSFMAAKGRSIVLLNDRGDEVVAYTGTTTIHEPRPVIKRKRERVIPPRINLSKRNGTLVLANVYKGRNMGGVKRGEIKKLLILESLPKPINYTGGMAPVSYHGTFTLERVLGTVPVEEDGSAHFELPANRAFVLAALDKDNQCIKRMQSFLTVMPGEVTSCVGCHENRTDTPINFSIGALKAVKRPASKPTPVPGVPEIFDFPRDIQPILDKYCVKCHNPVDRKGGILMTGDRGPIWTHSFHTLTVRGQFKDGRNLPRSNYPPRALWDVASPLMKKLTGGHHDVKATPQEVEIVRHWINAGAYYPGTYAALGTGMIGGYEQNRIQRNDLVYPEVKALAGVIKRRCSKCHKSKKNCLPTTPSHESQTATWQPVQNVRFQRHILYNLSRPQMSIILKAPLARAAGGYGMGKLDKSGKPTGKVIEIFKNTKDPDYQTMLKGIEKAKWLLNKITSFEMPNFRPRKSYIREMKRYGILPNAYDPGSGKLSAYEIDRRYFESLWYYPPGTSKPKLYNNDFPSPHPDDDAPKNESMWLSANRSEPKPMIGRAGYNILMTDIDGGAVAKYSPNGKRIWEYRLPMPIDAWQLDDGNILIAYLPHKANSRKSGVCIVTPDKKRILDYQPGGEVMSCFPLKNGNIMVVACTKGRVIEITRKGKVFGGFDVMSKGMGHKTVRMVRKTPQGTYLSCECYSNAVREYDDKGNMLREIKAPGAYCAQRLPDGNTLISCYYNTKLIEVDKNGKTVWQLLPTDLPTDFGIEHFCEVQRLPNGNTAVSNCIRKNVPNSVTLLEVTRGKKVVWALRDSMRIKGAIAIKPL